MRWAMSELGRMSEQSGWISPLIHEASGSAVRDMMFDNGDVNIAMAATIREQRDIDEPSYDELSALGRYLIPLDARGRISEDVGKYEVFMIGMNMALATLDALCDNLYVDIEEFRRNWREQGLTLVLNLADERVQAQSLQERYESVGEGVMELGYQAMDNLGQPYDALLDTASNHYPSAAKNPGTLRASFGYILSGGLRRLNSMVEEREFQQLFIESGIDEDGESAGLQPRMPDVMPAYRNIVHAAIAEELDTVIFYGDTQPEEFFGRLAQEHLDIDKRTIEVLNTLAYIAQPNDLGNFSLDEAGVAFFFGSVLALDISIRHAQDSGIDQRAFSKAWRGQRAHKKAFNVSSPEDVAAGEVVDHITDMLNRADITDAYDNLLMKLGDRLNYDEEEALAAVNGFHYMLLTGREAIKTAVGRAIGTTVKDEMATFDAGLARLLEG